MWTKIMVLDILLSVASMGGDLPTLRAVALAFGMGTMFESRSKLLQPVIEVRQ